MLRPVNAPILPRIRKFRGKFAAQSAAGSPRIPQLSRSSGSVAVVSSSSFTFLIGGARSGKSAAAVRLAAQHVGPVAYIVTAEALDDEMTDRIRHHRIERPVEWSVFEEPMDIASAISRVPPDAFIVIDCLSLWVANLVLASVDDIDERARTAIAELAMRPTPSAVVSNEVGLGIVPDNPLSRGYRDVLGRVNAAFADASGDAFFFVAGQLIRLTPSQF